MQEVLCDSGLLRSSKEMTLEKVGKKVESYLSCFMPLLYGVNASKQRSFCALGEARADLDPVELKLRHRLYQLID